MSAGSTPRRIHGVRIVILSLALASLSAWTAFADEDPLEQVKRRNEVAAQKLEADVRTALLDAQKASAKDPSQAESLLKDILAKVEEDTSLPDAKRDSLKRVLKDRIRVFHAASQQASQKGARDAEKEAKTPRSNPEAKASDADEVNRRLKAIRDAINDGKVDDAQRQVADLEKKYPDNPAVATAKKTGGMAKNIDEARRVKKDGEQRLASAGRDIDRSALPAAGDVEFPEAKKWKELTEKRKKESLSAEEKAILKALDTPIVVDFDKSRLEDVVDYLQTTLKVTITLDKPALDKAAVTYDTTITRKFKKPVLARTALRSILNEVGLTFVIQDETIEILTPEMAKDRMVVKAYPVGELVNFNNPLVLPEVRRLEEITLANQLIDMIKASVEPGSWDESTGAKIVYEPNSRALVIKASAFVHSILGKKVR